MADNFSALRTSRGEPSLFEQVRTAAQITPEAQYEMTSGASDTQFEKGLRTGAASLTAGSFANQALSQEVGGNDEWSRSRDLALQTQAQSHMYTPRVSSLRDIGSLEDAGDYAAGAIGQGAMSMAPTLATALLTRGRGKFGAASSFAGGAATAYNLERGEAALNQYTDPTLAKTSAEDRDLAATTKGVINAGLESIVPVGLAGSILRKPAGSFLNHVGREALTEGLTEAAQQGVGFGAEKYLDPNRQLNPWDVADAFAAGALTGGGMSAATRGPAHGAQALADRFARGREAAPVQEQGPAAEPPMDAAPPGTPLPPAPDDGSGGGVGGLFDTLNERFGPGLREQAQKTKDYVSDTIDRMGEAAKTAQSPQEFLRDVFGGSAEDAAAADLRHDTEDPGVMNSADPAAAMQQRDAQRQERAVKFAADLLNDPATPDAVKEKVASFGGDFSDPEARAFVARNLVSQRAGEKLANAVGDLIDLSKDFGGKAAEVGTDLAAKARGMIDKGMSAAADRIVKKNLQGIDEADIAPLVSLMARRLGPQHAGDAPKMARQLVAAANRLSPDAKINAETYPLLRSFSDAVDDNVLNAVTEVSGSDALRNVIAKIRAIPSARDDMRHSGGQSFLESMLKQPLEPAVLSQLADFVDYTGLHLADMSAARKDMTLSGLAAAFGSKREAQTVVEYYGNLKRAAFRREAEAGTLDEDRETDNVSPGEAVYSEADRDAPLPDRGAPPQDVYYADPKSTRPFYEGREGRLSTEGGTRRRVRDVETFMDRMQGRGVELRSQRYGDFLKERNEDSAEAVKRIRKDLEKRIAEGAPRKGEAAEYAEGRKKRRQDRGGQRRARSGVENAAGPEAAATLFSVARAVGERNELGITDQQLAESDTLLRSTVNPKKPPQGMNAWKAEKHNRDIAKTKIVFLKEDGSKLALSAESLWKAYAKGQPAGRSIRQLFNDAVSAVLNRPDIEKMEGDLDGVLIDRASGTYADPQVPDDVREAKKELAHEYEARLGEAESQVRAATSDIEDARDEGPADDELVERIEAAADGLQREADSGRITATALKDEAKSIKWEGGAPSPKAIELRARAAWERDISSVYADGARSMRETATEVRSELDRVENDSNDAYFGNEFRRLERRRNDLQHAYDVAHDSGNEAAIKDAKRRLDAVEGAIKRVEAREAAERAYGSAGRTASEERGGAAKVRNYDESTGAALHPDDKPSTAKPKGLGKRLDAALLANPELLEVLDARGQPKDKAMTESRMREGLFKAYSAVKTPALKARLEGLRAKYQEAKNASSVGTPAAREAAKQEAAALKEIGQMVRWILEQREGSSADTESAPKREDVMDRIAALPDTVERVVDGTRVLYVKDAGATKYIAGTRNGVVYVNMGKLRADGIAKYLTEGPSAAQKQAVFDALGITAQSLDAVLGNDKRRAAFLRDHELSRIRNGDEATYPRGSDGKPDLMHPDAIAIESRAVRDALSKEELAALEVGAQKGRPGASQQAPKAAQGKVVKKSFVGAKADPQGASDAEKLLGIGAPADVVWRDLGWFRGPDGKLRKEIRSPVLRRRVRDLATAIANGSRDAVKVRDLLAGIDAFKPYLDKLGDLPVDPNDGMNELMGAVGGYNGEDGSSSRGIGISRLNAELAARVDAVRGGKGIDLLREIVSALTPPELAGTGLNHVETKDLVAELEARHSMPDIKERVAELLAGTILHELQHAFQHVEGFENGGNATTAVIAKYGDADEFLAAIRDGDDDTAESITEQAFAQLRAEVGPDGDMEAAAHELYKSIVGEVEANDVAARMKLSDEEAASVKPALMDAERKFVHSVLFAEALSTFRSKMNSSKMGAKRGRPGKDWGDKKAVKEEILRLRGKDVRVKIEKLVRDLGGSGQYTYDKATGERIIEVAINAASPLGTARHEAMHDFFRFLGGSPAMRSVARDLRDATSAPHVIKRLRELLKDHKAALDQLSDPEERAAYAYQFWAEGALKLGPTGTGVFHTIRKFLKDMFGIVTAGQRGEDLLRAFHDGKFAEPSTVQEVLQDLNDANGDRLHNKMERASPALTKAIRAVLIAAPDRLRRFENSDLNTLSDMFFSETGKSGFIQNKYQQEGIWTNKLADIIRGTTAVERREAVEQLQSMKPESALAKKLVAFNKEIHEYMREAGVQSWDSEKKKFVPLREVQNYFTRSWDPDAIMRNRSEFEALLRDEGGVPATQAAKLADALARGMEKRPRPKESAMELGYMPYAPHTAERVLTFINAKNADKFAKFQHKDLADIMTSYVTSSTHRAEYARMFGNNGERIAELVSKSGITDPAELTEVSNAVQALEGSLDPGMWSPETKQFMSSIQTLQNVILLPLALASQMVDPIVLAARSGDIRDAGRAYITALSRLKNTITKSGSKVSGEELAEILGVVSENTTLQAMAMAYGTTRMSKRVENINRVFFKYNGMQGWNNSMRIAATAAGERYLIANKGNNKALAELGLTSEDVKVDKNGRLDVSSPKVQQAMFRFVDQAVLRPSAANRPVWMSDPRFLLVAHLKQFTYAMHNVVLKRANRELADGNPKPWGVLMLTMPVILAADMAKFALTGTVPSTWGFKDYLVHAVERSGLLGLGDFSVQATRGVSMGKMPGEGLFGPTFENLMEILRWIGGDPRTGFGDVIDRTVPGSRFI